MHGSEIRIWSYGFWGAWGRLDPVSYSLKLLEGRDIADYIGDYFRGYSGGYSEFVLWILYHTVPLFLSASYFPPSFLFFSSCRLNPKP